MKKIDIAVITGSKSDLCFIQETISVFKEFNISYSLNIASAHRNAEYLTECIKEALNSGVKVFIAVAGMSAALPGVIASQTVLPVIGVPVGGKNLSGLDSLLSIAQMPKGVPVATVALDKAGAANAAILAVQIIAVSNDSLREELKTYKIKISEKGVKENLKLQQDGFDKYFEGLSK